MVYIISEELSGKILAFQLTDSPTSTSEANIKHYGHYLL